MMNVFGQMPALHGLRQIFTTPSTVDNVQWHTWRKPLGCGMTMITCLGGGGGGGGGGAGGTGTGGGGGGGSSGNTIVIMPTFLLPDVLYVQVGAGGIGGLGSVIGATGNGASGVMSYVTVFPNTTASNVIAISGAAAAGGGGNGNTGAGTAGTAGTAALLGSMPLAGLGHFTAFAGQAGLAGVVTDSDGQNESIPVTGGITTGGASGGSASTVDHAGGGFTAIASSLLSQSRPAAPAAGAFNGSAGPMLWKPFFSFGGCGGSGSLATNPGGVGGSAAYGSGGGGGGSSPLGHGGGGTTVSGGIGGSGIVIFFSW